MIMTVDFFSSKIMAVEFKTDKIFFYKQKNDVAGKDDVFLTFFFFRKMCF